MTDNDNTDTQITPAEHIDQRIAELGDWRGEALAWARELIHAEIPDVEETWKWRGVPVWEKNGMICTGESYKNYVKLTFARGADLPDPDGLFNASLTGNTRRAIDIHEGNRPEESAFRELIRAAAEQNSVAKRRKTR